MDEVITSRANPRVKMLRAALEGRRSTALVAIEGPNLLAEALRSNVALHSIYIREDKLADLRQFRLSASVPIHVLASEVFSSISATENAQGVAAFIERPIRNLPQSSNALLLVLAGLQDPGNVGTLIRSAEAFGAEAVVTTPGTVDVWNQKVIRASAGSSFRLPLIEMELAQVEENGFQLIAAVARQGALPEQMPASGKRAIVIGNEGAGLSVEQIAMADLHVTIPCPGHVESLNAAIAGSLLLYAMSRQKN